MSQRRRIRDKGTDERIIQPGTLALSVRASNRTLRLADYLSADSDRKEARL